MFKQFLIAKLLGAGVPDCYVNFLSAYLEPRVGKVSVEGALSSAFELADTVFQGTVLGPSLWNTFFGDIAGAVSNSGGEETIFADDLTVHHYVPRETSHASIMHLLRDSQREAHSWGKRNRVLFDPSKEHFRVIHTSDGEGEPFKMLGCLFDTRLFMHAQVDQILNRVRPRVVSLLRTRNKYCIESMMHQYKSHIWSVMEYSNGCILHTTGSQLERLDSVQRRFLHGLQINEEIAFQQFNLAPPILRRDIGMLGLLHKIVLGLAHPAFSVLFPRYPDPPGHFSNKAFYDRRGDIIFNYALFNRSLLG